MSALRTLASSIDLLNQVTDAAPITPDDLGEPTPCTDFNVGELVEHVIDSHDFLLRAAGAEPVARSGSPTQRHAAVASAVVAAWTARGADGTLDLGGNELPVEFGVSLHAFEAYVHAWDLATALGRAFEPPAELTASIARSAAEIVSDESRGAGSPFGDAVDLPSDADAVARLVAYTGRDPLHPVARSNGQPS
jgi:uncharacterized protein (TIGR03086 family)